MQRLIWGIVIGSILCFSLSTAEAVVPVYNDLWDMSQGVTLTGNSSILNHDSSNVSSPGNMFGGTGGAPEPNNTLFEDYNYWSGSPHWITWKTFSPVTIGSFNLFATDFGQARSFSEFRLYAKNGSSWDLIDTFHPTASFGGIYSKTLTTPVTEDEFKAEFDWYDHTAWNSGPRIEELDGFAPLTQAVPEPATMLLLGLGLLGVGLRRKKTV